MNRYFAWFGLQGSFVLTLLMSLYALALALLGGSPWRWLCFAAMALSSVGDIFLMRFGGLQRIFPNYFAIGAGFFMLVHAVYTAAFGVRIRSAGGALMNAGTLLAIALCAACLAYFLPMALKPRNLSRLPLVAVYLLVISVACAVECAYAGACWRQTPRAVLSAIGAVSFLLSDAVIGYGMLTGISRHDWLIWWLYPVGQILLITGL